jgi:hypothetical protein
MQVAFRHVRLEREKGVRREMARARNLSAHALSLRPRMPESYRPMIWSRLVPTLT